MHLNKLLTILETVEAAIETQAAAMNKKTMANAKADKSNGNSKKNGKHKNTATWLPSIKYLIN